MDMKQIIGEYQDTFKNESNDLNAVLGNFYGQPGDPNRVFFYKLFSCEEVFFDFLQDTSLIPSTMKCEKCGNHMKVIKASKYVYDKREWYCGKSRGTIRCTFSKSIRHNSYFTGSHLRISTILLLSYEIFSGSSFAQIHKDLGVYQHACADWRKYLCDVLVEYVETNTEKIGGRGKIVEIDESKIGKRKYNRGHFVEGQWVFGGVERESGRCFLVAIPDRSADVLLGLIETWIEPETTVISDCWKAYSRLGQRNYDHLTVNHSLHFKDPETGANTNKIESYWRHFKASLPEYNRQGDFGGYIAMFIFRSICKDENTHPFVKFLEIIRGINWADWKIVKEGAVGGSLE